jgi:hypothetical protein
MVAMAYPFDESRPRSCARSRDFQPRASSVHAALMGKTPADVFASMPRPADGFDEKRLIDALTIRARRRVRRDNTLASVHLGLWAAVSALTKKRRKVNRTRTGATRLEIG